MPYCLKLDFRKICAKQHMIEHHCQSWFLSHTRELKYVEAWSCASEPFISSKGKKITSVTSAIARWHSSNCFCCVESSSSCLRQSDESYSKPCYNSIFESCANCHKGLCTKGKFKNCALPIWRYAKTWNMCTHAQTDLLKRIEREFQSNTSYKLQLWFHITKVTQVSQENR